MQVRGAFFTFFDSRLVSFLHVAFGIFKFAIAVLTGLLDEVAEVPKIGAESAQRAN
jgi:hypothetical protein